MSYLIREIDENERPRERFKKDGVTSLSNGELLSILIRTGTKNKSVMELSQDILNFINLKELDYVDFNGLKTIKGVGEVKAMTIICALELSKRILNSKSDTKKIRTAADAYLLVKTDLEGELQEKFLVIYLDTRKNVLLKKVIFIGTVDSSSVHIRDVFREAVKCNAVSLILCHNHPAGSINPSYQDLYLTNYFIKIGKLMEIGVIDHLIIGKNNYYSFRESNGDLFENKEKTDN